MNPPPLIRAPSGAQVAVRHRYRTVSCGHQDPLPRPTALRRPYLRRPERRRVHRDNHLPT